MAEEKRYFWLKLHDDFFDSKRIKKLRRMAGGDTYTIIYLKMQLLAMKAGGVLKYTGLEDNFAEELALDLDESTDNVKVTLTYLLHCGLAETSDNINFFFPYAVSNTGSENSSAQRVREFRERKKALQCNADVTQVKRECNGDINKDIITPPPIFYSTVSSRARDAGAIPTLEEVQAYADETKSLVDPVRFYDWYAKNRWRGVLDWREKFRQWSEGDLQEFEEKEKERRKWL